MEQTSQKSHDTYLQYVIFGSAIVAICTGLWTWSFKRMFIVYVGSILLGMLVVIPDWEYFTKRHYTEWIEPMAADEESRKLQRARFPVLRKTAKYAKREDVHIIGIIFFIVCTGFTLYFSWKFLTT